MDGFQARLSPGTHVLLCLDEFERLDECASAGWGARFLDALRHWLQHRPGFAILFIGSHTFEQLGPIWTDRFLSARRVKVSFLDAADVRKLLTKPTPTFNLKYAPEALEAIITVTHGQPFLTQVLASELVHHLNREHRKLAAAADIEAAINNALQSSAEYFADLWFSRSTEEQKMLLAIAGRRAASSADQAKSRVTSSQTKALGDPVVRALRDYDILDDSGDFAVPLVLRWLQQNRLRSEVTP